MGGKSFYLYGQISLFAMKNLNSFVKIDGGGGELYLFVTRIGNFPEIWMLSLKFSVM